jgi:glycosyltransferase involved in cell wall biosynthesis
MSPCLGTFLRFFKGKTPVITLADNVIPHEKRIGDRQFTAYFLATCDAVVAMSNAVVEDAHRFVPEKPIVLHPHPLYDTYGEALPQAEALQKLQLSPAYKYLLFFGFIRAYKGLDLLLEALADPRLADLPLKLIVAGEFYENPEKYEQLIQKYNLEEKLIRATHFIAADQVATYFSAADLIVQPYKSATQSGVSQVAYHFEKPIVVTNVGGLAEIIPHKKVGYVVEVQTEAIATAIADFFSKDKDINWTANIQEEKHRFRWESMVAVFTDLQKQLQKKC